MVRSQFISFHSSELRSANTALCSASSVCNVGVAVDPGLSMQGLQRVLHIPHVSPRPLLGNSGKGSVQAVEGPVDEAQGAVPRLFPRIATGRPGDADGGGGARGARPGTPAGGPAGAAASDPPSATAAARVAHGLNGTGRTGG